MAQRIGADIDQEPEAKRSKGAPPENAGNVRRETFLQAVKEISDHKARLDALRESYKATRKKWKAEGIVLGELDLVIKMTEWSRAEVRDKFETSKRYAEWMGLPTGYQANLFEGMTEEQASAHEWERRGYTAGLKGADPIPPEECPIEHHTPWLKGRLDGQITLAEAQGDKKKIAAAKKEHERILKKREEADARLAEMGVVDTPDDEEGSPEDLESESEGQALH